MVLISTGMMANNIADITIDALSEQDQSSVIVDLTSSVGYEVECQIVNDEGDIVYSDEFFVNDRKLRKFNLQNLPKGIYELKLEDDRRIQKIVLGVGEDSVVLGKPRQETSFKPTVINNGGSVDIHYLAGYGDVRIDIMDDKGQVVHTKDYSDEQIVSERYNLSQLAKGSYGMSISKDDDNFYYTIVL